MVYNTIWNTMLKRKKEDKEMLDKLKYRTQVEVEKWVNYPDMILYVGCDTRGIGFTVICENTREDIIYDLHEKGKLHDGCFEDSECDLNDEFDFEKILREYAVDYYYVCDSIEELKKTYSNKGVTK